MAQSLRVIGLMSGTSADGIDAALVELSGQGYFLSCSFQGGLTWPYPEDVRSHILAAAAGHPLSIAQLANLEDAIAQSFAQAAEELQAQLGKADLVASHGQTVFHRPPQDDQLGYSLQLGRGEVIAQLTGLPTISNFRQADLAAGGQGAPLVPPIDASLLSHPHHTRCVQNIGGIGNVAYLPAMAVGETLPDTVLGWDTGPGNTLIDIAVHTLSEGRLTYDHDGAWAAQGTSCLDLVHHWLDHPFFHLPPPKSTGRELFGWSYFEQCQQDAQQEGLSDADLLATLTELTAVSIVENYRRFLPSLPDEVLVCGGGSRNPYLMSRLQAHLDPVPVRTTDTAGVPALYKEAIAFAVLGYWRWHQIPGNLPSVTGAKAACLLGEIHEPLHYEKSVNP
ncbi:MAG TPA: anhydro-N-acetylmuramic acid kinase [Leptolyngbyaceae cyanobacterium]